MLIRVPGPACCVLLLPYVPVCLLVYVILHSIKGGPPYWMGIILFDWLVLPSTHFCLSLILFLLTRTL